MIDVSLQGIAQVMLAAATLWKVIKTDAKVDAAASVRTSQVAKTAELQELISNLTKVKAVVAEASSDIEQLKLSVEGK